MDVIEFISETAFEDIPDRAINMARQCLLDAVGCMVGGIQFPAVLNFAQRIAEKHSGTIAIAGTRLTSTRSWASFINSHACTFFDFDDGHRKAQGHPGGVIIPLSLMLAAENGNSGKDLLTAIVLGYEIAVRSALIMRKAGGPRKGSGGWNITGGVAAAAKLLKFSKPQIKSALGLAEYYAPQAPQDRSLAFPSSMKEGMAWASHSAINVIELAELEFDAMTPFLCDTEEGGRPDINWEICSVYFKMYACCRFAHPVLDGLMSMITSECEIKANEIKSIKVISFAKALLLNHQAPNNSVAAMYSLPFIIGCFLVRGRVGPGEMIPETLNDEKILKIAKKVVIQEDMDFTKKFPDECLALISVTLANGKTIHSGTLSAKGDPSNPYTLEEMRSKFLNQTLPLLGKKSEALCHLIMHIDHENPRNLWDMLQLNSG